MKFFFPIKISLFFFKYSRQTESWHDYYDELLKEFVLFYGYIEDGIWKGNDEALTNIIQIIAGGWDVKNLSYFINAMLSTWWNSFTSPTHRKFQNLNSNCVIPFLFKWKKNWISSQGRKWGISIQLLLNRWRWKSWRSHTLCGKRNAIVKLLFFSHFHSRIYMFYK